VSGWAGFVLVVWGIGFVVFASRIVAGLFGLQRIAFRAEAFDDEEMERVAGEIRRRIRIIRDVRLLESEQETAMPVTWGGLRLTILLPASAMSWPEARKRSVLSHELAHIARLDWLFQIVAEAARAIYWFHPLAWIAARQMRRESEQACDDAVLGCGI